MRLVLEQGKGAPRHALHAMWGEGGKASGGQHRGGERAEVTRNVVRWSWTTGPIEHGGGHRLEGASLTGFAGAKRAQWARLTEAAVTAGLREAVTGVTCLASVRPKSPRLAMASTVFTVSSGKGDMGPWGQGMAAQDEGGIYSW